MDALFTGFLNRIAPLLDQLLLAVVLFLASALLLKSKAWLDEHLTPPEEALLLKAAAAAVHFAEANGVGLPGKAKFDMACKLVSSALTTTGVTSITFDTIEHDVAAAVQEAFANSPYYHAPAASGAAATAVS